MRVFVFNLKSGKQNCLPYGIVAVNTISELLVEIGMVCDPFEVVFKELDRPLAVKASKGSLVESGAMDDEFLLSGWREFTTSGRSKPTSYSFVVGTIIIDL